MLNPDARRAYMRRWREDNRARIRQREKTYRREHPEMVRKIRMRHLEANRQRVYDLNKAGREAAKKKADMTWPDRLRVARQRLGLSQTDAGAMIGVTQTKWSNWENGLYQEGIRAVVEKLEGMIDEVQ